jgi:HEAT repeat protein
VEKKGRSLRLTYDVEYGRSSHLYRWRIYPPEEFDPRSPRARADRLPRTFSNDTGVGKALKELHPPMGRWCPLLGGFVISEKTVGGKRIICGTRGMVVTGEKLEPKTAVIEAAVKLTVDPAIQQKQVAEKLRMAVDTAKDLEGYAKHDNLFVRLRATEMARAAVAKDPGGKWLEPLGRLSADPEQEVRLAAVELLGQGRFDKRRAAGFLEPRLADIDRRVRDEAAISLARVGKPADVRYYEEIFEYSGHTEEMHCYEALAPVATREIFAVLLRHPLTVDSYEGRQKLFKALGRSLVGHPDAVEILLKAYYSPGGQPVEFAQEVFRHAGRDGEILARLHRALASEDRVIRSNAARGCGAIGDPASIPHLIKALDLESGLSRASVVWALGELKAREAADRLAEIYVDAKNDDKRRFAAGFRHSQYAASMDSQYDFISNIDSVGRDWDELKLSMRPEPVRPRVNEDLLSVKHVLDAVRKIGTIGAQGFFRSLAGEEESGIRAQVAAALGDGRGEDGARNLPVLRRLLSDDVLAVRIPAAVSLLILGDPAARAPVLEWLGSTRGVKYRILEELQRIEDGARLDCIRDKLHEMANAKKEFFNDRLPSLAQSLLKKEPKSGGNTRSDK